MALNELGTNLRWLPRLIWLTITSKVGFRRKPEGTFIYVRSAEPVTQRNGITRIQVTK